jgi:hypothetical protein
MQDFGEILFQDYNKAPRTENDSKFLLVWNNSVGVSERNDSLTCIFFTRKLSLSFPQ